MMINTDQQSEISSCSGDSCSSPQEQMDEFFHDDLVEMFEKKETLFEISRKKSYDDAVEKYNRKEKSLGQLSKKFLSFFGALENCEVSLDTVTSQLGMHLLYSYKTFLSFVVQVRKLTYIKFEFYLS